LALPEGAGRQRRARRPQRAPRRPRALPDRAGDRGDPWRRGADLRDGAAAAGETGPSRRELRPRPRPSRTQRRRRLPALRRRAVGRRPRELRGQPPRHRPPQRPRPRAEWRARVTALRLRGHERALAARARARRPAQRGLAAHPGHGRRAPLARTLVARGARPRLRAHLREHGRRHRGRAVGPQAGRAAARLRRRLRDAARARGRVALGQGATCGEARHGEVKPPRAVFAMLLCGLATWLVLQGVTANGWTRWDDDLYVTDNPLIRDLPARLGELLSTPVAGN